MTDPQSTLTRNLPQDRWTPVVGWEGFYEITPAGLVRRVGFRARAAPLRWHPNSNGYPRAHLSRGSGLNKCLVHLLVARTFLGPCPEGMEVNHKDSNRWNPASENLEYITRSGNSLHAHLRGALQHRRGETHEAAKLTNEQAREIKHSTEMGSVLAARFGVGQTTVRDIRKGRCWRHVD